MIIYNYILFNVVDIIKMSIIFSYQLSKTIYNTCKLNTVKKLISLQYNNGSKKKVFLIYFITLPYLFIYSLLQLL